MLESCHTDTSVSALNSSQATPSPLVPEVRAEENSSEYPLSDDWAKSFDSEFAAAMDKSTNIAMANATPRQKRTPQPQYSNPTSQPFPAIDAPSNASQRPSNLSDSPPMPSPARPMLEAPPVPVESSMQPLRFSDGTIAWVPIVQGANGRPIFKTYKRLKHIADTYHVPIGLYELALEQQMTFLPSAVDFLRKSSPVIVRRTDSPHTSFGLEFLTSTYKIPPHMPVDMHGKTAFSLSLLKAYPMKRLLNRKRRKTPLERFFFLEPQ